MKALTLAVIVLLLFVVAVGCEPIPQSSTTKVEQKITETNQERLINRQPIPELDKSLERENIIKRLKLLNDESKVFYVYLLSHGKVMAFYVAQGKVSSLNTYLTGKEKVIRNPISQHSESPYFLVESPDIDGTYGSNAEGVFFFTSDGAYVEWNGEYMVSDRPLVLVTPPELVMEVKR